MATKIQAAVEIMRHLVTHDGDDGHGYDQRERWGENGGTCYITVDGVTYSVPGGDYDCSSSILTAYKAAGIPIAGASYTGNYLSQLTSTGQFESKPLSFIASPGDAYLNDANHVAMCLRQVPDQLMEFSINERGGITGGKKGDQTGWESHIGGYYDYPWNRIMHYIGDGQASSNISGGTTQDINRKDGQTGSGIVYEVHTPAHGWLGAVDRVDDSEDGYAGWMDSPIDGIRAYRKDGKPLKIQVYVGQWWEPTTFTGSLWGQNPSGDGYAGNINSGKFIEGIRVDGAEIRVAVAGQKYFGWYKGGRTPEGDDFAGEDIGSGKPIVALQMRV